MSFGGCNYTKLKTNLRLSINRFKLLEKKKTELALKARKEIADYISNGKEDRARIRVEHIVREDYLVEAMEILEMYCDLLLARFGLIQTAKELDPGLEEPIASLLWSVPRLQADIPELRVINEQFTAKYKKEFVQACRQNTLENVNMKLMHKMSPQAPPKLLIERYMIEIARTYNVPFVPDPTIMAEDEVCLAEGMLLDIDGKPGGGSAGSGGGGHMLPPAAHPPPQAAQGYYPPPTIPTQQDLGPPVVPSFPPAGSVQAPPFVMPSQPGPPGGASAPAYNPNNASPPPGYTAQPNAGGHSAQHPGYPTESSTTEVKQPEVDFPELPSVPTGSFPSAGGTGGGTGSVGDDVDFDDLTRRFQELKKRK